MAEAEGGKRSHLKSYGLTVAITEFLAKLLIEKGAITDAKFKKNLGEEWRTSPIA